MSKETHPWLPGEMQGRHPSTFLGDMEVLGVQG